jgi:hypothetical protein
VVASRLALDPHGRLIAEGTCVELRGLRWLVLGDTISAGMSGYNVFFLADKAGRGRIPTAREQADSARRAPYSPAASRKWREQQEVPDEQLDDAEALEAARREQQRRPADLISSVY